MKLQFSVFWGVKDKWKRLFRKESLHKRDHTLLGCKGFAILEIKECKYTFSCIRNFLSLVHELDFYVYCNVL